METPEKCDLCDKLSEKLEPCLYHNGDKLMLCPKCWDSETARGDMLYEVQKEEGGDE